MSTLYNSNSRANSIKSWNSKWLQLPICLLAIGIYLMGIFDTEMMDQSQNNGGYENNNIYFLLWKTVWFLDIKYAIPLIILALISAWIWFISHIRQQHDCNKSGLWFLVKYIPFIGLFIDLECAFPKSTSGKNDSNSSFNSTAEDEYTHDRMENKGGHEANGPKPLFGAKVS